MAEELGNPSLLQDREIATPAFLYRISRELSAAIDLRRVLETVLRLSMENIGAASASIIVLDDQSQAVDSILIYQDHIYADTTNQLAATLTHGLAGWVLQHRRSALIPDTSLDKRWLRRPDDGVENSGAKSAVATLLTAREQPVGVMTLVHPSPGTFDENHLALIQSIADQAGVTVLNARLYAESQRQIVELGLAHQRYRELQETLTAMIYHDLRSPLANITNSLDIMKTMLPENDDNEVLTTVLGIALRAAARIKRLTDSLLDINRLEEGQLVVNRKAVDITELLREAADSVLPFINERSQQFSIALPASLPLVWIDRDMIARVIINLLENASKYTPNGNRVAVGAMLKADEAGRKWVEVRVEDSGYGIPAQDLEHVFEKFARLGSHQDKAGGFGLGLTFCRLAVEGNGGKIWLESEVGTGSRFYFTLPVVEG